MNESDLMSDTFQTFFKKKTPEYSKAWMETVKKNGGSQRYGWQNKALAYLAVLAASGLVSGIHFHVKHAKSLGASRKEVIGAVLVGLL